MSSVRTNRFVFLDVLRGLAVLWMIQVHVTNVMLDPELRTTKFFELLNLSNGFVAPAFIFCAGSGLWIALSRKGTAYLQLSTDLWQYVKRLLYVLFWAYMLHVPYFSLELLLQMPAADIIPWLQIDVLQTIVYSSLVALSVFLVTKNLRRATISYGVIAAIVAIATPFVWMSGMLYVLPDWVSIVFLPTPKSPFPLIPWSAYLFAGAFLTGMFMESKNKPRFSRIISAGGFLVSIGIYFFKDVPPLMPWHEIWWSASPSMLLFRISGVVVFFGLLYQIESLLERLRIGRVLQVMGRESLFMYLTHLMIVYGAAWPLIQGLFGFTYTDFAGVVLACIAVTLPLTGAMMLWHRLKQVKPATASRMVAIQTTIMVLTLLFTPANFSFNDLLQLVPW